MADKKITEYGSLSAFSSYDKIPVVDVSDTTMAASGTTKFMLGSALLSYLSTYYAPITSVYGATRIISENHQFISGMTFKVYNVSWINEGFTYTSNFNEYVVISDGDDYYPRKDIVVLDLDDDTLDVVEGEAVADIAAEPSLLPNQLRLFVVDVPTGATSLTGITTGTMYDEAVDEYGGEWDVTASGGSVATASTDDSSNGLFSIKFSTSGIGQYATLSVAEAIVVTGFGISFQFKQPVAHDYKFAILVYDTSANISYPVLNIEGDAYGLDSTSTAWQEVFISMPNVSSLDQIRIQNLKNDSTFYIDEVEYQYGLPEAEVVSYLPTGGYSGTAQELYDALVAIAKTEYFTVAVSDETTALTTGTASITFRMPYAMTLTEVRASVVTAPTGANLVVDINESGTTILSTKLSIDAGEKTSTTAATSAVISDSALADDAEITIDIDQIGSTIAGAGLKITLIGTRS